MFQLHEFIEARLATLTPRSEKHGDEDKPAVSLGIEITGANTLLDLIDPKIRHALYMAVEGQEQLPGVEPATPVLRCNSFERHTLPTKYDGWTMQVDDGIDETKPAAFGGCKLDKFSVEAKQGGTVVLRLRIGTSDLDAERSGLLGMHVGQPIWVTFKAPEKQPDAIDASRDAKDLPADAGSLFADQHGGPDESDDEGGIDGDALRGDTSEPLGADPAIAGGARTFERAVKEAAGITVETSRPGTRTARGRDKTAAALAAGAKANGTVQ